MYCYNVQQPSDSAMNLSALRYSKKAFIVRDNVDFPCNLNIPTRSKEIPKDAHQVRPGDIDVIGAIGDSLSVGYGASAVSLEQVFSEMRGKSFSIEAIEVEIHQCNADIVILPPDPDILTDNEECDDELIDTNIVPADIPGSLEVHFDQYEDFDSSGQGTWRTSMTLPNILKVFNPNLIGYSLATSLSTQRESQFNVAEVGAVSAHMPYMAKVLVHRMKTDPRVNIEKDWKLITHMIGDNDFCTEICFYNSSRIALIKHKDDLVKVLRILKANLPRTIVNVVPPPHLQVLTRMFDKPFICHLTHSVACPCLIGLSYQARQKKFLDVMRVWQKLDIEISNSPEFDLDDFTVIPHQFTLNYTFPKTERGTIDYRYLSEDCFHLSEKGQARFAHDLWNSMLEPFGKKSTDGSDVFEKFNCPSERHPFIFTRRNSQI
ncbi:hypothetical protein NQ318_018049 [Aromia moschata]|uniref:Phospholipase B1, membrane-associated n=1 Tax=Aromia moschata TaxID=1265417 RepID=A0AAV8ZD45_9CUCU|nr:hypothetical protein NQ318_018049 [Aromia moschata]